MKQSWLWVLLPLGIVLAVLALFFALFFGNLINGELQFAPIALFTLSLSAGSYALVRGFRLGWNLSTIISAVIALFAFLASIAGLTLELQGMRIGGIIAGLLSVTCLAVLFVSNGMDEISVGKRKKTEIAAGPAEWADRIEAIGRRCTKPDVRTKVLRLGGETRFLTPGTGQADLMVNQTIGRAIDELAEAVKLGNDSAALSMLPGIRSLFAQRENQLKP
ncbi:MAG TPA: hypothetical protein DEB17_02030 [Chlorobaculum sp.]|uniref:Uncharacterized protein n=1 Tax=Chlorobaculum tepidum (strain ATCC 49652 / DSM 12025 / NBRC 103806 / TLS) TaxID=194439 RepID=Q8KDL2_CHLTE|nr:hypothetical protein [Chlorobaculum tepidum]AAM72268.1 hypothetical protein CT1035 [Chlorobaculum tepidum TLS]HBU22778.1 hypothetical protein [Chlorobaculum sp.]